MKYRKSFKITFAHCDLCLISINLINHQFSFMVKVIDLGVKGTGSNLSLNAWHAFYSIVNKLIF